MSRDCVVIRILREPGCEDISIPAPQTMGAAGVDLHAAVEEILTIPPGEWRRIPVGFRMALPEGYEAQIRPRSGLSCDYGVTVLNTPGTIDSDYRGVVSVILVNFGRDPFTVHRNDRIAQMVIQRVVHPEIKVVDHLEESERNDGGFGSTGGY